MAKAGKTAVWGVAIAFASALLVIGLGMVRLPVAPLPPSPTTRPGLVLSTARQDDVLRDQLQLYDPTPLFLPTPVNIAERALPVRVRREPGAQLRLFEPVFAFPNEAVALQFPESISTPATPAAGLSVGSGRDLFLGIGAADSDRLPLPPRLGFLEIIDLRTGATVSTQNLPSAAARLKQDWGELKLQGAISSLGLVGELTLITGSGSQEADDFFRNYLAKVFRVGERLPPGFYRFRVGP